MAKLEIDDFFELEFSKIPKFWKFDKKLFKRFIGILIGLGIIDLIMIIIIPFTQKIKDSGFRLGSGETFKYATYNMGLGMVLAVDPADVEKTMEAMKSAGDKPYVVGKIVDGEKGVDLV